MYFNYFFPEKKKILKNIFHYSPLLYSLLNVHSLNAMKFLGLLRLRRKHENRRASIAEVTVSSSSPTIIGDSNYTVASSSASSSSASSSSSAITLTIPIVHEHLIPTSRSGPLVSDRDDDDDRFDLEDRFVSVTPDMLVYPEIFKEFQNIECLGVCRSHPHVIKARYHHKSSSSTTPVVVKIEDIVSPRPDHTIRKHSRHEAAIFSTLNSSKYSYIPGHAYIVQLYDHHVFESINKHVFIFEYCQYGTLFTVMNGYGRFITPMERMQWALDISKGLAYMHEMDVAHRDIKLENIGLCWSVAERRVAAKIIDLGFSNFYSSTMYDLQFSGSVDHFAPEILRRGRGGYHPIHADLWAYAVTLYCLFEGRKPFPSHVNTLESPHLTSCSYYRPQIMAGVPSFERLLRCYFTESCDSRPSIQSVLNESQFFLEFPCEPVINIELFDMLERRYRRHKGYPSGGKGKKK